MEFLFKNLFQNTNLSIHSPSLLPTDPKVLILMNMWDAGACAVALAGASLLAKHQLLAKNGDFLGVLVYARRDSLAENRAM